jgi:hypothetical protein
MEGVQDAAHGVHGFTRLLSRKRRPLAADPIGRVGNAVVARGDALEIVQRGLGRDFAQLVNAFEPIIAQPLKGMARKREGTVSALNNVVSCAIARSATSVSKAAQAITMAGRSRGDLSVVQLSRYEPSTQLEHHPEVVAVNEFQPLYVPLLVVKRHAQSIASLAVHAARPIGGQDLSERKQQLRIGIFHCTLLQ